MPTITSSPKLERRTPGAAGPGAKLSSQSCDSFGTFSQSNSSFLVSGSHVGGGCPHTNIACGGEDGDDVRASRDLEVWVKHQAARISEEQELEEPEEEDGAVVGGGGATAEWSMRQRGDVAKKAAVLNKVDVGEANEEDLDYNDVTYQVYQQSHAEGRTGGNNNTQQARIKCRPLGNAANFFYSKSHHQFSHVREDFRDLYMRNGVKRLAKPKRSDGIGTQLEKFAVWGGLSHVRHRHSSPTPMLPDHSGTDVLILFNILLINVISRVPGGIFTKCETEYMKTITK